MNDQHEMKNQGIQGMETILVVGAGIMGHGFAQFFAQTGLRVILIDRTEALLERARSMIAHNLEYMVELGEIESVRAESVLQKIRYSTAFEQEARGSDFVLEAVVEDLATKKDVFRRLGKTAPSDTILASNTSSYDINEFSRVTAHPERVIGTHWFFPPQITPCVEIIPAELTSREVIDRTIGFMEQIGKAPTSCASSPGFVANRIQYAMVAEAMTIVDEGLATAEEVDRIVKTSFGFRLGAYGPFEICDQAGLDTYYSAFEYLHDKLQRRQFEPPSMLKGYVERGELGVKTGKGFYGYPGRSAEKLIRERDQRLYARLRIFRNELKS